MSQINRYFHSRPTPSKIKYYTIYGSYNETPLSKYITKENFFNIDDYLKPKHSEFIKNKIENFSSQVYQESGIKLITEEEFLQQYKL